MCVECGQLHVFYQVGDDVVLFSTDGASLDWLVAGVVPGVLPTVDFGSGIQ